MIELEILIPLSPLDYLEIKSYNFDINLYLSLTLLEPVTSIQDVFTIRIRSSKLVKWYVSSRYRVVQKLITRHDRPQGTDEAVDRSGGKQLRFLPATKPG